MAERKRTTGQYSSTYLKHYNAYCKYNYLLLIGVYRCLMAHTDVYLYPDATLKYHDAIIIFMLLSMFLYEQLLDIRTRCYTSVYIRI
jgi:hypothetical protein